uniref:Putative cystatin 1 n=1 Tax=Lonomia obliqua TaxID=304329 RepID=Q5MGI0_LONON|nr:putative cystatin precursor 1 [Lonomia obliqua]
MFQYKIIFSLVILCAVSNFGSGQPPQVGGVKEADASDPSYKPLAELSLKKYLQSTGSEQTFPEIKIERVTQQVVAGIKNDIEFTAHAENGDTIKCQTSVVTRAWLNETEVLDVKCQIVNK